MSTTTTTELFTPDDALELLFQPTPALIPQEIRSSLPPELHIRPLASTDHLRSHLSLLRILTEAPDILPTSAYTAHFQFLKSCPSTYYTLCIIHKPTDKIVAIGSLFVERKFTRSLGCVGHIEDIAVDPSQQGKKLGLRIIQALTYISEHATEIGCYKTILNCSDSNIPFYEKCGFRKKENEMAKYNEAAAAAVAPTTTAPMQTQPHKL